MVQVFEAVVDALVLRFGYPYRGGDGSAVFSCGLRSAIVSFVGGGCVSVSFMRMVVSVDGGGMSCDIIDVRFFDLCDPLSVDSICECVRLLFVG